MSINGDYFDTFLETVDTIDTFLTVLEGCK